MFRETIREAINYFCHNEGSVDSPSTLWEAFKTVIRGECIAKQAGVLRSLRGDQKLEKDIGALEWEFFSCINTNTLNKIRAKMDEFQEVAHRETLFLGKETRAR